MHFLLIAFPKCLIPGGSAIFEISYSIKSRGSSLHSPVSFRIFGHKLLRNGIPCSICKGRAISDGKPEAKSSINHAKRFCFYSSFILYLFLHFIYSAMEMQISWHQGYAHMFRNIPPWTQYEKKSSLLLPLPMSELDLLSLCLMGLGTGTAMSDSFLEFPPTVFVSS